MPQSALTIVAHARRGETESLKQLLASMGDGVANGSVLDLGSLTGVHFARVVLVDETTDLSGAPLPASLVYMSDVDVPSAAHLRELAETAGAGIDALFGHCDGYPPDGRRTVEARIAFLERHVLPEQARYVNTPGRTVAQVRAESELRDAIEGHLDENRPVDGHPPKIRASVQRFVDSDPSLRWARNPPAGPSLAERVRNAFHFLALPLVVLVLSPLLLLALPAFAILLRLHERRDPAPHLKPDDATVRDLAALEDHLVQNPFTAIGFVKPGPFRRLTIRVVLFAIAYATRHVFNRGSLAGVKTIHFARWVFLDGGRVIFASNYDGSLESYMDDFIDKIAWGLNIVFSNGVDYPRTRWLVLDGASDEVAFKDYLRRHQVPTHVWYSAYGRLTTSNLANNTRIRAGLGSGDAERWVQAL